MTDSAPTAANPSATDPASLPTLDDHTARIIREAVTEIIEPVAAELLRRSAAHEPLIQPGRFRMTSSNWMEAGQKIALLVAGIIALQNGLVGIEQLGDFAAPLRSAFESSPILSTLLSGSLAILAGEFTRKDDRRNPAPPSGDA